MADRFRVEGFFVTQRIRLELADQKGIRTPYHNVRAKEDAGNKYRRHGGRVFNPL